MFYLIPIIACLVFHFVFGPVDDWKLYLWIFLAGEVVAAVTHILIYRHYIRCKEYLGTIVTSIHHEDAWTEIVTRYETRTDSKGRTYTVTRTSYVRHPEKYYFYTDLGTMYNCTAQSYFDIRNLWRLPVHHDSWTGFNIRGGVRFGQHYTFFDFDENQRENPDNWIPITESHRYVNKIRRSNSIFKFETITKKQAETLGLHNYPKIVDFDAPAILWGEHPYDDEIDDKFRKFNAYHAPNSQMRLYVLLFPPDKTIGISELQRAYWQGGNKNEFILCIGLDNEKNVQWARAFSWADYQDIEAETAQWLISNKKLDWNALHDFLVEKIPGWKRKEFSDFHYIFITLPLWYNILIAFLAALASGAAIYFILRPPS